MSERYESPLLELFEPVFTRVCEARSAAAAGTITAQDAAGWVQEALNQAETRAKIHPELERDFTLVRHDVYFFADHVLAMVFKDWHSLAAERLGIVAGDEIFCHDLEEMLEESEEKRDELMVFRTCIGLGFNGSDAVGAKRWRQDVANLTRTLPLHSPGSPESAGRLSGGRRQGPARRRWWPILLFAWLSLMLLALSAWQLLRAPVVYRRHLTRLQAAAGLGRESESVWVDSPSAKER